MGTERRTCDFITILPRFAFAVHEALGLFLMIGMAAITISKYVSLAGSGQYPLQHPFSARCSHYDRVQTVESYPIAETYVDRPHQNWLYSLFYQSQPIRREFVLILYLFDDVAVVGWLCHSDCIHLAVVRGGRGIH